MTVRAVLLLGEFVTTMLPSVALVVGVVVAAVQHRRRVATGLAVTGLVVALIGYSVIAGRYTLFLLSPETLVGLGAVAHLVSGEVSTFVQRMLYGTGWVLVIVAAFRAGDRSPATRPVPSVDEHPGGPASAASLVVVPAGLSAVLSPGFVLQTFLELSPYAAGLVAVLVLRRRNLRPVLLAWWACLVPLAVLVSERVYTGALLVTATETTALSISLGLAREITTNLAVTAGCVLLVLAYVTRGHRR